MFENLSSRLNQVVKTLRGQARLTEDNIKETLREIRVALLEADVALPVVKTLIDDIRQRAVGQEVSQSLSPGQILVKIVNEQLTEVMGQANESLDLTTQPPAVILMAGLQGAGKTTTVGKLARLLKEQEKKTVLVASCDVYRPAAIEQLNTLANELNVGFFPSKTTEKPTDIARNAIKQAAHDLIDVVIIDTAGRLHIDEEMMGEIKEIHQIAQPVETLFVVDSMTGQDAANTAKAFNEALPLTGIILTKTDGDARGGAALSVRQITGKPIKFMGTGEKSSALEAFHPDRVASRILGMGDVLSLVEEIEQKVDKGKADKLAKKIQKGKGFDLADFRDQLLEMNKLGGISGLIDKLPGMGDISQKINPQANDKEMGKLVAIINSMTPKERIHPTIIKGSRKRRIAMGSGTKIQDVNKLLKQFTQMQKMMKKMKKGGMKNMMRSMQSQFPNQPPPFR